jgi:hypothetical protein
MARPLPGPTRTSPCLCLRAGEGDVADMLYTSNGCVFLAPLTRKASPQASSTRVLDRSREKAGVFATRSANSLRILEPLRSALRASVLAPNAKSAQWIGQACRAFRALSVCGGARFRAPPIL